MEEKKRLIRVFIREKLKEIPSALIAFKSKSIVRKILNILESVSSFSTVGAYFPIKGEVDVRPLIYLLQERGKRVALPAVSDGIIVFREVEDLRHLRPGAFGIPEPSPEAEVLEPEVLIIPGVAFDRGGVRLGRGGGFYDRYFESKKSRVKIGVCFHFQLFERLPALGHDARVDWVVTEMESLRVRR